MLPARLVDVAHHPCALVVDGRRLVGVPLPLADLVHEIERYLPVPWGVVEGQPFGDRDL